MKIRNSLLTGALAVMAMAPPVFAADPANKTLPGVSNEETTVTFADIREYHFGKGDVLFVRNRTNKWYRLALNDGCLAGMGRAEPRAVFDFGNGNRLDLTTKVRFLDGYERTCLIDSIRASAAPPQVDSKSVVTLD